MVVVSHLPICRRNMVIDCMSRLFDESIQQATTEGLKTQSTARVVGVEVGVGLVEVGVLINTAGDH